jgi:hypothetical protein
VQRDQERDILQVVVAIADEHVEEQPAIELQACGSSCAAMVDGLRQRLNRGGGVLERARFVQQLASIDAVQA